MRFTTASIATLGLAYTAFAEDFHGEDAEKEMGPVAFMWPADRVWSAVKDNTAPCGSAGTANNRTEFPLLNGAIALVAQDDGWKIAVSISYSNDPTSNDDFTTLLSTNVSEMDPGHLCLALPDPTRAVTAGENATIQIKYTSDFEDNKNETYYACADISYVDVSDFTYQIPCFNVSSENFTTESEASASATSSAAAASETSTSDASHTFGPVLFVTAMAGIVAGLLC